MQLIHLPQAYARRISGNSQPKERDFQLLQLMWLEKYLALGFLRLCQDVCRIVHLHGQYPQVYPNAGTGLNLLDNMRELMLSGSLGVSLHFQQAQFCQKGTRWQPLVFRQAFQPLGRAVLGAFVIQCNIALICPPETACCPWRLI